MVGVILLCQLIHFDALLLGPANFWVANHDILGLLENDREYLCNVDLGRQLFCDISSTRWRLFGALSVLQFCRVEHHGNALSWSRSAGNREHPVIFCDIFGWIRFQPRGVRRCTTSLLDSDREDIESIALSELFRITGITLHCPFHESLLSNYHWMGCRCYFAASRLEVLLDEDDSRSSSRAHEHGSFLLDSQLHVAIQTLWGQCTFPRAVWTNRWIVHFPQVSPFLFDLRLRFRPRLCFFIYRFNRHWHTTLAEWRCFHRSCVCVFATKQDFFSDLLSERTWWLLTHGSPRSW